jgi:glycosyltransferase involved in cell wall biosynthesis
VPIVQNAETLARLPRSVRDRAYLLGHITFIDMPEVPRRTRGSHVLFLSSLESRKGMRLALHALAQTPEDVRLVVVGDGPERESLERMAENLGVAERVEFRGKLPRAEVFEQFAEAAAVVYPALREEGGVALGETLLSGTPVVVLGNGGPRDTASLATDPDRVAVVAPAGVAVTARRMAEAMTRFSRHPSADATPLLDQAEAARVLRELFERALGSFDGDDRAI